MNNYFDQKIANAARLNINAFHTLFTVQDDSIKNMVERFSDLAEQLAESEFLGIQIDFAQSGNESVHVFSDAKVAVTEKDYQWVFREHASLEGADEDRWSGFTRTDRKYYVLSVSDMTDKSTDQSDRTAIEWAMRRRMRELMKELKECGASLRLYAFGGMKGSISFSFSQDVSLRVKAMVAHAFPGSTLKKQREADEAKTMIPMEWVSFCMEFFFDYVSDNYLCEDIIGDCVLVEDEESAENEPVADKNENDEPQEAAFTPIEELNLSLRAYNALRRARIFSVEQLRSMTDDELMKVRNLGKKSFVEIKDKLSQYKDAAAPVQTPKTVTTYQQMLDELIGLENVKAQIKRITAFAQMQRDMIADGKEATPIVLNMEFVGNPGTAKTTVARITAGLLREIGLLDSNEIVEVGRADLVAKYEGQTADKVKSVFESAVGRLLFIDEAYSLFENQRGEFGDEAINTLVQEMENNRKDTVVIFAGYPDQMKELFARNPGLRSRVPFTLSFQDYTAQEMTQIAELEAKKRGFEMTEDAKEKAMEICERNAACAESGNGRFCRNLVENAILNYACRIYGGNGGDADRDYCLTAEDFTFENPVKTDDKTGRIGFAA